MRASCPTAPAPPSIVDALEDVVRPADDLVILFTSGSRGAPKGVIHTHGGALRATAAGLEARCIGAGERLYIPMPFFWTGGFSGGLLSVLVAGATLLTESDARAGAHDPIPRARARDAVPRLAGPGRAHRGRTRTSPTADLTSLRAGEPRRGAAARRSVRAPGRARTSSA